MTHTNCLNCDEKLTELAIKTEVPWCGTQCYEEWLAKKAKEPPVDNVTNLADHVVTGHASPVDGLLLHTIYDHPSDFAEYWVVRSWVVGKDGATPARRAELFNDLGQAHGWIEQEYPHAVLIQPQGVDEDANVHEVWA